MTYILSLDDEPEILLRIRLVLEVAGYKYLCTTDSKEALSILRNQQIDLFTQDLKRPDMDGWEVYQIMKAEENLGSVPVLLISAYLSPSDKKRLAKCGDKYLIKPFLPETLLPAVTAMIKAHRKPIPTEEERLTAYERFRKDKNWSEKGLDDFYKRISNIILHRIGA